jgi:hypothetical protein
VLAAVAILLTSSHTKASESVAWSHADVGVEEGKKAG